MITALHTLRLRALLLLVAILATIVALPASPATASPPSPDTAGAAAWLAGLVGPAGSVENPYDPGVASATWTVNVALSLVATGTEPEALASAMGYIRGHVDDYVVRSGIDYASSLAYLILLVEASGGDSRAFGTPPTDLVARLGALLGADEAGLFGAPDSFSAATNQSLALLALVASGAPVPADAVAWLVEQQCGGGTTPASAVGGWQPYRARTSGALVECSAPDSGSFSGADTNTTAFAVQALVAVGSTDVGPAALIFLRSGQATTGTYAAGFPWHPGGSVDPNSTALVLQALVATGQDLASWVQGGASPLTSLEAWVIPSGDGAGALASSYSDGFADSFATHQGVWGLALSPFPFAAPVAPVDPILPVDPVTLETTPPVAPEESVPAAAVIVVARFTG